MTIKSLTITEDAYDALKKLKLGDESFSEVILRVSNEKVGAAAKFFGAWKMSEKEANETINRIKKRRKEIDLEFKERQEKFKKILSHT